MMEIRNKFRILLAQKEVRDGRSYTYDDITEATGVARATVASYMTGAVSRYDSKTLRAFCDWFDCELSEMLEYPPAMRQQDAIGSIPVSV